MAFAVMPDEIRVLNQKAILSWPDHAKKELLAQLKTVLRGAKS